MTSPLETSMSITSYPQAPLSCFIARAADGKRSVMNVALSRIRAVRHGRPHPEKNNTIPLYHLFILQKIPVVTPTLNYLTILDDSDIFHLIKKNKTGTDNFNNKAKSLIASLSLMEGFVFYPPAFTLICKV